VREVTAELLAQDQRRSWRCASAEDALKEFGTDPFDVVSRMSACRVMSGIELARCILTLKPASAHHHCVRLRPGFRNRKLGCGTSAPSSNPSKPSKSKRSWANYWTVTPRRAAAEHKTLLSNPRPLQRQQPKSAGEHEVCGTKLNPHTALDALQLPQCIGAAVEPGRVNDPEEATALLRAT